MTVKQLYKALEKEIENGQDTSNIYWLQEENNYECKIRKCFN